MGKQFTIVFYECEHNDDLDTYADEMISCGARVDAKTLNYESEMGIVEASTSNLSKFRNEFMRTKSFEFSSWYGLD